METLEEVINRGFAEMTKEGFDPTTETHLKYLEIECNDLLRLEEKNRR